MGEKSSDDRLEAMERDHPDHPMDRLLEWTVQWTCLMKNTMYDLHRRTPYQMVFGFNPELPDVMT